MLEYIYFVKCPDCEDEPFSFFSEAKEFAMSLLSKKPIITQIEVNRNDFGECTDSCDLGTVWSWEEMMDTENTPTESVFTKDDLENRPVDEDPEFAALDNSVTPEVRKPIPEGMTIEQLVEEMEENEDEVECTWCNELFGKDQCRKEVDLGWLCDRCQAAIMSRGEPLTFRENSYWDFLDESADKPIDEELDWHTYKITYTTPAAPDKEQTATFRTWQFDVEYAWRMSRGNIPHSTIKRIELIEELQESANPKAKVEFVYDKLPVTLYGPKRAEDDWDEAEEQVEYTYKTDYESVVEVLWNDCMTEEDVSNVPGGLDALYADDKAFDAFMKTNFDDLVEKYMGKLLDHFETAAIEEYESTHSLGESAKKPADSSDLVELEYPSLTTTLYGEKRAEDDWDEVEHTDSHVFLVPKVEVATAIWENWITEDDVKDVEGGLEALEDDIAWEKFLETHFDDLFEKYNKQILKHFEDEAIEDFRERSQEDYSLGQWKENSDRAYDELMDDKYFNESKQKPFLEEFDDAETHKANLTDCPECGARSYDMKEQYCTNCGLNL